jgi:SOS-response transcriptional repressor LexA
MSACAGSEPFALQVLGDSMEPEFHDGAVIIVEPSPLLEHGCYVVAQHDGEYLLRQLANDGEHWQLKPLNPRYPTLTISGPDAIRGRVIQRCGRRRHESKSYL